MNYLIISRENGGRMNKLSRKEKVDLIEGRINLYENSKQSIESCARSIIGAIDPPEIKVGMWGEFWMETNIAAVYGRLESMDSVGNDCRYSPNEEIGYFPAFTPLPGLKEAIEKVKAEA